MAKKNKSFFKFTLVAVSFLLTISLIPIWISPAEARIKFKPPVTSAPTEGDYAGGASRDKGSCAIGKASSKNTSVVKLLPKSNIGLTAKQRPSIMVYIPATTAQKAFFSVQDENFNHHYQTTLDLPQEAGVMEIKLPASAPALSTGKKYQYSLAIICGEYLEPDDRLISGWIERVDKKGNRLDRKVSVELASELAAEGMWYDALSTLAELRKSQPSNQYVANSWQQLLNSVGLNEIAQESIVN
ncbi:MAG: DUF928 domain-containing protein [Rivularia sp. (in: Bacteria)]|nr:DUF928 domain-containing protein [Rivularia sp. MS3]